MELGREWFPTIGTCGLTIDITGVPEIDAQIRRAGQDVQALFVIVAAVRRIGEGHAHAS